MQWPSLLVLVRHGESQGNTLHADERAELPLATHAYPLTERGRQQASITGEYLRQRFGHFDVCYTSYYERARQTMRLMFPEAKLYEDARLSEAQRGIYHTMTRAQILARYPEEIARKDREGLYHYRPWGGENWMDVESRVHSMLGTLRRDYGGKTVCICGHGHWFLLMDRLIKHFSIDEAVRQYNEDEIRANASVTIIRGDNRLHYEEYVVPWEAQLAKLPTDTTDPVPGDEPR